MVRALSVFIFTLVAVASVNGEEPKRETMEPLGPTTRAPATVIKLTLRPQAAPVPALKYQLLPELRDQTPGNAALLYYRAFSPEYQYPFREKAIQDQIDKWSLNARQVPEKSLGQHAVQAGALRELDRAARREYCDWEMTARLRRQGPNMLLPEVQGMRRFATLLAMRARVQISEHKYDEAARTFQTGFALARHVAEGPTLIHGLVGIAMTGVLLEQVEELIQEPGSPNLYWALTSLPRPIIDMRKPLQGEKIMVDSIFPDMRSRLTDRHLTPMSPRECKKLANAYILVREWEVPARSISKLHCALALAASYPEARQWLISQGRPASQVDSLPMVQVAVLQEIASYDVGFDAVVKWHGMPYWKIQGELKKEEERLKQAGALKGFNFASSIMPALTKVFTAQARTQRRIDVLRCLEAIRLHAAASKGKFPAKLSDIKDVPVPIDLMTGKDFIWKITGDKATLSAPRPPGLENAFGHNLVYELKLK